MKLRTNSPWRNTRITSKAGRKRQSCRVCSQVIIPVFVFNRKYTPQLAQHFHNNLFEYSDAGKSNFIGVEKIGFLVRPIFFDPVCIQLLYQYWRYTPGFCLHGLADHQHCYPFYHAGFDFLRVDFNPSKEACEISYWSFYFSKQQSWLLMLYFQHVIRQQYSQGF